MNFTVRNVGAWMLAKLLILLGFVERAKKRLKNGEHILAVCFHQPSRKEFEYCVKWLKNNGLSVISPADLERVMNNEVAFPKGGIVLTVDDGWESNATNVAEVASEHQVPVTILVSTEPVEQGAYWWSYLWEAEEKGYIVPAKSALKKVANSERMAVVSKLKAELHLNREAMTAEQVKNIAAAGWVTIGGHTHTHPILINCPESQVYEELEVSKLKLESWTEHEVMCFAYPNGDYGKREIAALKATNYRMAFNTKPYHITVERLQHRFELPRFSFLEGASRAENICRIMGVWQPITNLLKFPSLKKSGTNKPSALPRLNKSETSQVEYLSAN